MLFFKAVSAGVLNYGTIDRKITDFMSKATINRKGKSTAIDIVDIDAVNFLVKEALPDATSIRVSPYPFPGTENFDTKYMEGRIAFASGNNRGEVFCALPLKAPEAYVLRFLVEMLSPDGITQVNIDDIAFNADLPPLDSELRQRLQDSVSATYSSYLRDNNERVSPEETDTWPVKLQAARDYKTDADSATFLASLAPEGVYKDAATAAAAMAEAIIDKNKKSMLVITRAETFRSRALAYIETTAYSEIYDKGNAKLLALRSEILDA